MNDESQWIWKELVVVNRYMTLTLALRERLAQACMAGNNSPQILRSRAE
jgi:hypothetical protein